jgi:CubicO group peptidase (beta-lactamase class C family)
MLDNHSWIRFCLDIALALIVAQLIRYVRKMISSVPEKKWLRNIAELSWPDRLHEIDDVVEKEMQMQHIAGLSVGIIKDGKIVLAKGYGYANIHDAIPATENTIYKIASVSKHIVAVCIMKLAEQGKLSLSDSVHNYYDDAPAEWESITIRNLLNLTSGLRRESPAFKWTEKQPLPFLIESIYRYPLSFKPGSKWRYGNMDYFILADIIQKVSGESFEDYMNHFFAGHGLMHTTTTTKGNVQDKATGYSYTKTSGTFKEAMDFAALRPSGAFVSNIHDMLLWDTLLFESNILSREAWYKIWHDTVKTGNVTNTTGSPLAAVMLQNITKTSILAKGWAVCYGYGWAVTKYKGQTLLTHGGGTLGFTSEYWKFMDNKISIIILANTYGRNLAAIATKLYALVDV